MVAWLYLHVPRGSLAPLPRLPHGLDTLSFSLYMPGSSMPFSSQLKGHLHREALPDCHTMHPLFLLPAHSPPAGHSLALSQSAIVFPFMSVRFGLSVLLDCHSVQVGPLWPCSWLCSQCLEQQVPDE